MLFFAGILVVSSANLLMEGEDDHDDSSHLENNTVLKIANWMCDSVDYYDGEKFFTLVSCSRCVVHRDGFVCWISVSEERPQRRFSVVGCDFCLLREIHGDISQQRVFHCLLGQRQTLERCCSSWVHEQVLVPPPAQPAYQRYRVSTVTL